MEAAIRWSPHHAADDARFLIIDILNSSLSLHQVRSIEHGKVESEEIGVYSKLPNFAAFDWSKTTANIISLGHVSGSASLLKLNPGLQKSEIIVTFKAKQQRRCNSTALSTQNWLAVALDKTRSDLCLNIYDAASTAPDPVRRLCPAELISSVRFFTNQPNEILAGAQRAFIRLYDLRDGFTGSSGNLQVATKNVNNIAIDPLDENYFTAGGGLDDPSITVWDKRYLPTNTTHPDGGVAFRFKPAIESSSRASVWSLRYSGSRRGRLAISSSAGELKIIDMHEYSSARDSSTLHQSSNIPPGSAWTYNNYVDSIRAVEMPSQQRASAATERIIAFDWAVGHDDDRDQKILVLRANRERDAFAIRSQPAVAISTRDSLSIAFRDISIQSSQSSRPSTSDASELLQSNGFSDRATTVQDVLASSNVYRDRCKAGYLFNCFKNTIITSSSKPIRRMWESIQQLRNLAADDGMVYESVDFSFVGINGLWNEQPGASPQRRLSPSPTKPVDAIIGLNEKREIPGFEGERTNYPEHRQLCLAVCGWKFTSEDVEAECQALIDHKLYYQAVVQAVLHGAKHLAVNLLRTMVRGKIIPNIGLGALIAADALNQEQRDMTLWMAADTEDLALKALLAYLYSGDWRDVMKTTYLDLGYRLALGLKYLNDTELDGFIQSETARAIKKGDLEGVLLTGLTEESMDLFQAYIARTNDLQTAVLATAFTNPLYIDDPRWSMWKETYFMQMQAWRAFAERTRFTIEHNRLAKTREGHSLVEPTEAVVKLRCVHCHNAVGRAGAEQRSKTHQSRAAITAANTGTVCLKCGRHLPRCSVCTMWLGSPDPRKAKPAVASTKTRTKEELMEKMLVFCTKCEHGSHANHAREWFAQYSICPVPGCACRCNNEPAGQGFSMLDIWQTQR